MQGLRKTSCRILRKATGWDCALFVWNFPGLEGLDGLILAHNRIKEIPSNVFHHLSSLTTLELEGNAITHLDPEAFMGLEGSYSTCDRATSETHKALDLFQQTFSIFDSATTISTPYPARPSRDYTVWGRWTSGRTTSVRSWMMHSPATETRSPSSICRRICKWSLHRQAVDAAGLLICK